MSQARENEVNQRGAIRGIPQDRPCLHQDPLPTPPRPLPPHSTNTQPAGCTHLDVCLSQTSTTASATAAGRVPSLPPPPSPPLPAPRCHAHLDDSLKGPPQHALQRLREHTPHSSRAAGVVVWRQRRGDASIEEHAAYRDAEDAARYGPVRLAVQPRDRGGGVARRDLGHAVRRCLACMYGGAGLCSWVCKGCSPLLSRLQRGGAGVLGMQEALGRAVCSPRTG